MAQPWFRLYVKFASDPKMQTMSEANQRRWIMVLCLRGQDALSEIVQFGGEAELARVLNITHEELLETKAALLARNLISDDWVVLNWDDKQYASDSSRDRVQRFRESKRDVTLQGCYRNGDVTKRVTAGVTEPVTAPDTDTDTETETEKSTTPRPRVCENETDAEAFYQAYPKHVNHKDTLDKYATLLKQKRLPAHTELMAALERHKNYWLTMGTEMQFIPAPNVWLNKRRWEDELPDVTTQTKGGKPTRTSIPAPGSIPTRTFSWPEPPPDVIAEWQSGLKRLYANFQRCKGILSAEERIAPFKTLVPLGRNGDGSFHVGAKTIDDAAFFREQYAADMDAVFGVPVVIEPTKEGKANDD